jgi:hypothetical protein
MNSFVEVAAGFGLPRDRLLKRKCLTLAREDSSDVSLGIDLAAVNPDKSHASPPRSPPGAAGRSWVAVQIEPHLGSWMR